MTDETTPHDEPEDDEIEYVSRGELKRDMQELRELGRDLTGVSAKVLAEWNISSHTLAVILEGKRLVPRALTRHVRYLAKLLTEEDVVGLRERLDSLHRPHQLSVAAFHRAEQWRDRLLAGDDSALQDILQRYPAADTQRIRQLARNGRKEAELNKAPKSARELFKLIAQTQQAGEQE